MSKSRAAPLKQISLPKLELMAAVLAARLSDFIRTSLNIDCTLYLWSDSQIVLHWIASQKKLKPFVNHRVSEIWSISSYWKYCPSTDNPADLLTRGVSSQQLASAAIWKHGPPWLMSHNHWPLWEPSKVLHIQLQDEPDDQPTNQSTAQISPAYFLHVIDVSRYSSLQKLLAVTAYVLCFINITQWLDHMTGHLTPSELSRANLKRLHIIQHEVFSEEIANLYLQLQNCLPLVQQLRLFVDSNQLLRCGGRIHNVPLSRVKDLLIPR